MIYDELKYTKKEQVLKVIDRIHFEHRYDAGAMMGTLSAQEAERKYTQILNELNTIPGLTDEERDELSGQIETRIKNIPQVEAEKEAEDQEYKKNKNKAFEEAKTRYKNLSVFTQIRLKLARKDPNSIDTEWLQPEQIEDLYR